MATRAAPVTVRRFSSGAAVVLNDTYTLSPSTVLDLRYGISRTVNNRTPLSYGFDLTKLGFPASYANALQVPTIPQITDRRVFGRLLAGQPRTRLLIRRSLEDRVRI